MYYFWSVFYQAYCIKDSYYGDIKAMYNSINDLIKDYPEAKKVLCRINEV